MAQVGYSEPKSQDDKWLEDNWRRQQELESVRQQCEQWGEIFAQANLKD